MMTSRLVTVPDMLKTLCFWIVFASCKFIATAQHPVYQNHRIAISADGNNQADEHSEARWPRADPDDWGGTPAALAILAKANLQNQVVHYSYNNFIAAPPHTDERNFMAEAANYAIEHLGFDESVFFDVSAAPAKAIDHLAEVLQQSTASDPLFFIHMGPSEFFYQAVAKVVSAGKQDALAHVYVISHSGYNDNHLRRTAHHTMAEAIALSDGRINYQKIKDQNACKEPEKLWCSGTDFTPFYWMRDHSDPALRWVYSRLQFHPGGKGADISDAGMVYYLLTGDEYGNLSKLKDYMGDGIMSK
ncbi:hypothetical protein [Marinoscillum furvescens]|uniref:Uncharacterized protein n=1 Tax=Marinoscillum furvescens DSM 4134 TaxID=1122208 RepID=A0A3D9L280_MARFU|nr:hypothetical protein [Marinoscillum furvescens]RED96555.1 hypothetical protein C7460_11413 [Marinoscillum furvescens DSM 4134]